MKSNSKSVAQSHTGLSLRTQLRVGEYANTEDYVTQFHKEYGCVKKIDYCDKYRQEFNATCLNNCSVQGNYGTCANICEDGTKAIAYDWGYRVHRF